MAQQRGAGRAPRTCRHTRARSSVRASERERHFWRQIFYSIASVVSTVALALKTRAFIGQLRERRGQLTALDEVQTERMGQYASACSHADTSKCLKHASVLMSCMSAAGHFRRLRIRLRTCLCKYHCDTCVYTSLYTRLDMCLYTCLAACPYTCLHACLHMGLYVCPYLCLYSCLCTRLSTCLCTCLHTCLQVRRILRSAY